MVHFCDVYAVRSLGFSHCDSEVALFTVAFFFVIEIALTTRAVVLGRCLPFQFHCQV
jgi:hypothetical protein